MTVDSGDAAVGTGLQQLGADNLFDSEDNTVAAADANGGAAIFDGLVGVFDLEVAAVGREDGVGEIVAGSYGGLTES